MNLGAGEDSLWQDCNIFPHISSMPLWTWPACALLQPISFSCSRWQAQYPKLDGYELTKSQVVRLGLFLAGWVGRRLGVSRPY